MNAAIACPFCRGTLNESDGDIKVCPGCGTPHHTDCFEENGGCTVFGCTAAPAPEAKMSIANPELAASPTVVSAQPRQRPLPPPPPPGSSPAATPPLFSSTGYTAPQPIPYMAAIPRTSVNIAFSEKSRTTFVVLGIVLGALGAHSFYLGSTKKGILQLALTLITFGFGGLMVWIWAIIDVCTITTDHNGHSLRN